MREKTADCLYLPLAIRRKKFSQNFSPISFSILIPPNNEQKICKINVIMIDIVIKTLSANYPKKGTSGNKTELLPSSHFLIVRAITSHFKCQVFFDYKPNIL